MQELVEACGSSELRNFHGKLTTKHQCTRTGFFIAPGGFTKEFHAARREHAADALIIPVDASDLERWIEAEDPGSVLRETHKHAAFDSKRGPAKFPRPVLLVHEKNE